MRSVVALPAAALLLAAGWSKPVAAFSGARLPRGVTVRMQAAEGPGSSSNSGSGSHLASEGNGVQDGLTRGGAVLGQLGGALAALGALGGLSSLPLPAAAAARELEYMPGIEGRGYGKPRTKYPDFTQTASGLQFKDVKEGSGASPATGDRVVMKWEGYTIGYYGRPFEAAGKVKGGAFDATDKDFFRFVLGKNPMIPALEEALTTMKPGGIRQIIVPPELGYPKDDPEHNRVGPKPSTFSGQRALNFVLENQGLVDKTLLINVELKRVDKPGERGFKG